MTVPSSLTEGMWLAAFYRRPLKVFNVNAAFPAVTCQGAFIIKKLSFIVSS